MRAGNLGAQTWLVGIFVIVSNPKGRSSVQLAADLGITQKSAWHLGHRIRAALADGSLPDFEGPVQADETYVGAKAKNMHAKARRERIDGRGAADEAPVVGVKDRSSGKVAAVPVHEVTAGTATAMAAATTRCGADVFTDGSRVYDPLEAMGLRHAKVIHSAGEYVRGPVWTNGVENCWSLLKRACIGTCHWWSQDHLNRYVDEHSFRYNRRSWHVIDRMGEAVGLMEGRSLTWRELASPPRAA